jgi:hypothetical protein
MLIRCREYGGAHSVRKGSIAAPPPHLSPSSMLPGFSGPGRFKKKTQAKATDKSDLTENYFKQPLLCHATLGPPHRYSRADRTEKKDCGGCSGSDADFLMPENASIAAWLAATNPSLTRYAPSFVAYGLDDTDMLMDMEVRGSISNESVGSNVWRLPPPPCSISFNLSEHRTQI